MVNRFRPKHVTYLVLICVREPGRAPATAKEAEMAGPFGKSIKHQTFILVPPENVYDTITTPEGWDAFFTTGLEVEPVAGGKIVFRWRGHGPDFYHTDAEGTVVEAVRPGRFAFQWYPVGQETPTTVTFSLTGQYGGTVVRLTEDGYPDTPDGRAMILECAAGWGEALTLLKFYLEHGLAYTQPQKER
jgi:uncharacterized protein YndB with AHSA1/START domain